jgi:hypothetical protein
MECRSGLASNMCVYSIKPSSLCDDLPSILSHDSLRPKAPPTHASQSLLLQMPLNAYIPSTQQRVTQRMSALFEIFVVTFLVCPCAPPDRSTFELKDANTHVHVCIGRSICAWARTNVRGFTSVELKANQVCFENFRILHPSIYSCMHACMYE